jgi:hypothetical protein
MDGRGSHQTRAARACDAKRRPRHDRDRREAHHRPLLAREGCPLLLKQGIFRAIGSGRGGRGGPSAVGRCAGRRLIRGDPMTRSRRRRKVGRCTSSRRFDFRLDPLGTLVATVTERGAMRTIAAMLVSLILITPVAAAPVDCSDPNNLCTGDPCIIDSIEPAEQCVVDFGPREVQIRGLHDVRNVDFTAASFVVLGAINGGVGAAGLRGDGRRPGVERQLPRPGAWGHRGNRDRQPDGHRKLPRGHRRLYRALGGWHVGHERREFRSERRDELSVAPVSA